MLSMCSSVNFQLNFQQCAVKCYVLVYTDGWYFRHILLLQKHRCWGGWDVEWEVKVESILGIPAVTGHKLVFKVKQVNLYIY